jgi:hypothetical protein
MRRFIGRAAVLVLVAGVWTPARGDDKDTSAILDRAIKALGGEEKLGKVRAASWKTKGTINIMNNDNDITTRTVVRGLDHYRLDFEGDFGGNKVEGATVVAGDKGWRKIGADTTELDKEGVANEKRTAYLSVIPLTVLPLKGKDFKVEPAGEEKVGGKAAVGVKVTPADGKEFRLYFDKESGLPVKLVARVAGFMGEFLEERTYGDYKEMAGIRKATKYTATRDGAKYLDLQLTDFEVLDKVDPKTFTEPR